MTFYNTNLEEGKTLKGSKKKANRQEDEILSIFRNSSTIPFTAEDVHNKGGFNCPLALTRRAVTDLYNKGILIKLPKEMMRMGSYGKKIHSYKFKGVFEERLFE